MNYARKLSRGWGLAARVTILGAAIGTTGGILGCGSEDNPGDEVDMGGVGGSGGGGGADAAAPDMGTPPPPVECSLHTTTAEIEMNILQPKCAQAGCHNTFGPRLDMLGGIDAQLFETVTVLRTYCHNDPYLDPQDPANSFFLRKLQGEADTVMCLNADNNDGFEGGARMPAKPDPAMAVNYIPDPTLINQEELDCLIWYTYTKAAEKQ